MGDLQVGAVNAKVGADVSGYKAGMVEAANATRDLGAASKLSEGQIRELFNSTEKQRAALLEQWRATNDAAAGVKTWTDAMQRAQMALSGTHDQALKMNAAMDEGKDKASEFGGELLKMVGLGAAAGGGIGLATAALGLLKDATIGSIEAFVEFGHRLDLLHTKIDVPVETAAAWEASASVTGVSAERIASTLAMMDSRLAQGSKQATSALNDLGISLEQMRASNPQEQLQLLTTGLEHIGASGAKADVIVKELFGGRIGLQMLPALTADAAKLRAEIEGINGPLEHQVETAVRYETSAAILSAHWASIRRTLTEPLVGGLADFLRDPNTYMANINRIPFAGQANEGGVGGSGAGATGAGGETLSDIPGGFTKDEWDKHLTDRQEALEKANAKALAEEKRFADAERQINADAAKVGEEDEVRITKLLYDSKLRAMKVWGDEEAAHDKQRLKASADLGDAETRQLKAEEALSIAIDEAENRRMREAEQKRHAAVMGQIADLEMVGHAFEGLGNIIGGVFGQLAHGIGATTVALGNYAKQIEENTRLANAGVNGYTAGSLTTNQKIGAGINAAGTAASIYEEGDYKSGAMRGAAAGAQFGPAGAAIGFVAGAYIGLMGGDRLDEEARKAGNALGHTVSVAYAKELEQGAKAAGMTFDQFIEKMRKEQALSDAIQKRRDVEQGLGTAQGGFSTIDAILHPTGGRASDLNVTPAIEALVGTIAKKINDALNSSGLGYLVSGPLKDSKAYTAAQGVASGAAQISAGMRQAGFVDQKLTEAMGGLADEIEKQAYDAAIAAGLGPTEATKAGFGAIAPILTQQLNDSLATGQKMDAKTQELIDTAKANGINIVADPLLVANDIANKQLDSLDAIKRKLLGLPEGGGTLDPTPGAPNPDPTKGPPPGIDPKTGLPTTRPPGYPANLPWPPEHHAGGGIVPPSPGGRLIVAGDGGEAEAVIPMSRMGTMGGGGNHYFLVQIGNREIKEVTIEAISEGFFKGDPRLVPTARRAITGRP